MASALNGGTEDIIEGMEVGWAMDISRAGDGKEAGEKDKTIAVGSSVTARMHLKGSVRRRGIHVRGRTVHLGIDHGAGDWGKKARAEG